MPALRLGRVALLIAATLLTGCAAQQLTRDGEKLLAAGQPEAGLAKLEQAAKADPEDLHYRANYINRRDTVINRLLLSAEAEREAGNFDAAETHFQTVLRIDPNNSRAKAGVQDVARTRKHSVLLDEARARYKQSDLDGALQKLQFIYAEAPDHRGMLALKREIEEKRARETLLTPTLRALYKKPVKLEFRDAPLSMVFEVLSNTTGINFVLDRDVRPDQRATLMVRQAALDDVVNLLLATNQLEKKILSANTVLIYPNTTAKNREYQDLVVKAFYLENCDVKQAMNMVKSLLKTRDIFLDEKLNLMVMRDTPDAIRLAEKMVAMLDLAEPEVMLELEVLEVNRTRLLDLGIQYPQQTTLSLLPNAGAALTLNSLRGINSSRIGITVPNTVITAQKVDTDVNLLANPRIRTRNREKAKIMIGDRVPVITTTSTATGFISDSVQYLDVGLKVEVEPNIYLQDEVAIKVALEVSSIVSQITSKNGTQAYQIGSRNASTVLRLKDGETQVLAGLINDSERETANKVPGLGDLPVAGRLFSNHRNDHQKSEIVLSITPHLVRTIKRPDIAASEFWSGSDAALRTTPLMLQAMGKPAVDQGVVTQVNRAEQAAPATQEIADDVSGKPANQAPAKPASVARVLWSGPQEIKRGEEFQLAVKLNSDGAMRSMPFQMTFDPAVLRVVKIEEGGFFRQNSGQSSFTHNVDPEKGKIFVGTVRSGTEGASGEETMALVTFKALTPAARTAIRLLAATPVATGDRQPELRLPDDHQLTIKD
ncbi:MAG: secretin and TonB N-terminal domain-containing protein [Nitrosomonadales bacterium]|nr:secretin and TonB N-terminal domain-containing protein [Nitrosomonadales bacterium]